MDDKQVAAQKVKDAIGVLNNVIEECYMLGLRTDIDYHNLMFMDGTEIPVYSVYVFQKL